MPRIFKNMWGLEFDFDAHYKSKIITEYWKNISQIISYICIICGWKDPSLTNGWSALTPPPLPLSPKSQHDPLSLTLMPTKLRRAFSNGCTQSKICTKEKNISHLTNMITLDNFTWYPRCVPEVDRPKFDRVLIHVGEKVDLQTKSSTWLKKYQIINLCLLRLKM